MQVKRRSVEAVTKRGPFSMPWKTGFRLEGIGEGVVEGGIEDVMVIEGEKRANRWGFRFRRAREERSERRE